jgi:hypothetical protein
MPPQLGDDRQYIVFQTATVHDLAVTRQHHHPLRVYGEFVRRNLAPCYKYRRVFASRVPGWVPDDELAQDRFPLHSLGGARNLGPTDPEHTRAGTELARADYYPPLQRLEITDFSDRAIRAVLELCRHRGITVVLFLSPEGTAFRSWYPPTMLARIEEYCRDLSREFGAPLIDARDWLADDDFTDSHHVNAAGAARFTRRLNRDVLRPLVEERLSDPTTVAAR